MSRPHSTETVFTAISHPIRRRLLDLLRERERDVQGLAEHFTAKLATISQHLQVLRVTGLVTQRRVKRHRLYTLSPRAMRAVFEWLQPYESQVLGRRSARAEK